MRGFGTPGDQSLRPLRCARAAAAHGAKIPILDHFTGGRATLAQKGPVRDTFERYRGSRSRTQWWCKHLQKSADGRDRNE
jgi:hypothetical protein